MNNGASQAHWPNWFGPTMNINPNPRKPMDSSPKLRNIKANSAPNNRLPTCKSSQPSVFRLIQVLMSTARSPVITGSGLRASNRPSLVVLRAPASQFDSDNDSVDDWFL